jgi:hypothetical protein
VLICSAKKILLAGCWWLIADKPSEQGAGLKTSLPKIRRFSKPGLDSSSKIVEQS